MANQADKTTGYWDFYDFQTGKLLEKERRISRTLVPSAGQLIVGIPGKPNAIIRTFKFKGIKDRLPCYEVYV